MSGFTAGVFAGVIAGTAVSFPAHEPSSPTTWSRRRVIDVHVSLALNEPFFTRFTTRSPTPFRPTHRLPGGSQLFMLRSCVGTGQLTFFYLSAHDIRLKALSIRLSADPAAVGPVAPLPASARIPNRDISNDLKRRWNNDIEGLVHRTQNFSVEVRWGEVWKKLRDATSSITKS
jgi:hypothetical protein